MEQPYVARVEVEGVAVLTAVGEFDISTVDILRETVLAAVADQRRVTLDLSATTFLDSLALGAIVSASKKAREAGGWLRLVAPSSYVRRVLRVTQVDTVLGLYDSADEAIAHDVEQHDLA